jgi:hypothetical protein
VLLSARCRLALKRCAGTIGRRAGGGLLVVALAGLTAATAVAQETLVERTVAIVGGAAITLADVRTALALGLVEAEDAEAERAATTRLVERALVLQEVSRFAPAEPAASAVDARLSQLTARAGSAEAVDAILARGGFSRGRLLAWIRDDLRIAAYLDQRFANAGTPGDLEVADYAAEHAAELAAAGVSDGDRLRAARERLQAERRRDLIADWLGELRRRTVVVEFKD